MAKSTAPGWYDDGSGRKRWWNGSVWTDDFEDQQQAGVPAPAVDPNAPLYAFTSHIEGKNARVEVYADRIEWERRAVSGGKVAAAMLTLGASAAVTGGLRKKDTEMVPIKAVSSITSKKGMGINTVVSVATSAGTVDFRTSHSEAEQVKTLVKRLLLEGGQPQTIVVQAAPVEAAPAAVDHGAQLVQLKSLLDSGILTTEEYDAKKAEILARM